MPPAHCSATGADWAHRRLSIIDITGGAQPMSKIYSDYHYHIVYNGEIYNTDDLRHKLTTLGVHFKTTSDTEVLLLGFIHFGPSFIQDVDGILHLPFMMNATKRWHYFATASV